MKSIVLAAGYATRLYPLTENFPKPLLEVAGKSILDHLLDDIDTISGIDEHIIISNHKFLHHFEEWKKNCKLKNPVTIIDDGSMTNETRLGAVCDIQFAIETLNLDDDLLIVAGDNLLDFSLSSMVPFSSATSSIMRIFSSVAASGSSLGLIPQRRRTIPAEPRRINTKGFKIL